MYIMCLLCEVRHKWVGDYQCYAIRGWIEVIGLFVFMFLERLGVYFVCRGR